MTAPDLQAILAAGVRAPSGDNLQPWRFETHDGMISVFGVPKAPELPIDATNTLIACGLAIENMVIAAHALGYGAQVAYSNGITASSHIADLTFPHTGNTHEHELYAAIERRVTNRKPFKTTLITPAEQHALMESVAPLGHEMKVRVVTHRRAMRILADTLAINVRHFLEDETIHHYLFGNLRWNKKEKLATRDGMPIQALQVNPVQCFELGLMRSWKVAKFLGRFNAGKMAAKANADTFVCAGAFVALLSNGGGSRELVEGGRALSRLWLTITEQGLAAQPFAGFAAGQGPGPLTGFDFLPKGLAKDTEKGYQEIRRVLGLKDETIIIILRVGHTNPIPQQTLRRKA